MDSSASEKAGLAEAERMWPLGDVTRHKQYWLCSCGFGPRGFRGIFCERVEGVGCATQFFKVRRTEPRGRRIYGSGALRRTCPVRLAHLRYHDMRLWLILGGETCPTLHHGPGSCESLKLLMVRSTRTKLIGAPIFMVGLEYR